MTPPRARRSALLLQPLLLLPAADVAAAVAIVGRRVLITPPPTKDVVGGRGGDGRGPEFVAPVGGGGADADAAAGRPPPATPNWMFLYPRACARLLSSSDGTAGASVRSAGTFDIPPDSCQGGYYGNGDLDPEQVLREGLAQRGDDWDLLNHVLQRGNSAFRGTTKQIVYPEDGVGAASFAGEDGHVYEVTCLPSWDVNKHLQGRVKASEWAVGRDRYGGNAVLGEHEYAVPSRVPPSHIKRYGRVVRSAGGTLFVPRAAWTDNPAWNPAFCRYSVSDYAACEAMGVLMREVDLDGNGALGLDEFQKAMEAVGLVRAATTCDDDGAAPLDPETIFRKFDVDGSDSISAEELRKLLMETENCSLN